VCHGNTILEQATKFGKIALEHADDDQLNIFNAANVLGVAVVLRLRVCRKPFAVGRKGKLHRGVDAICFDSVFSRPQWQCGVETFRGKEVSVIFRGDCRSGAGTSRQLLRGGRNLLHILSDRSRVNLAFRFVLRLA
jgi:hypothetical protein